MSEIESLNIISVDIPIYRINHIKRNWNKIFTTILTHGNVQIRYNIKERLVQIRAGPNCTDNSFVNRTAEFVKAVVLGFKIEDSIVLLNYKDTIVDYFEISDVKKMRTNHLQRAIGRIIGRNGGTKTLIENQLKVKFLLMNERVTLIGTPENIALARDIISRLIQGAEPTSITTKLSAISKKIVGKHGLYVSMFDELAPPKDNK